MKKTVRQTQKITNMAGERVLHRIERAIGITIAVMLAGLLYSAHGTRGLPVPWLGSEGADPELFLASLFITFLAVFCIDLLAAAVSLVREPSADRQTAETSVIVNAVEYAEYEDDENGENDEEDENDGNSLDAMFGKLETVVNTLSSRLEDFQGDGEGSGTSDHNGDTYADRAERDTGTSQIPGKRSKDTKNDNKSFARALTGNDGNTGKKRSSAVGVAITLISLLIVMIAALPAFNDDPDDVFDDWDTENVVTDDEDDLINYDTMYYLAVDALSNIGDDSFDYMQEYILDDMTQSEFDAMRASDVDWGNAWFEEELGRSYNEERTRVTIVYRMNDDSNTYIAAFNFSGSNLDESDLNEGVECNLEGFTVFPDTIRYRYGAASYPDDTDGVETDDSGADEEYADEYEPGDSNFDVSALSEEEFVSLMDAMQNGAMSAGKKCPTAEDALLMMQ